MGSVSIWEVISREKQQGQGGGGEGGSGSPLLLCPSAPMRPSLTQQPEG